MVSHEASSRGCSPQVSKQVSTIFLSGICGAGMASLAAMLQADGHEVSGSDAATYPPMSTFLEGQGIRVFEGFSEEHIEKVGPDLVVIGNALSRGNPEVEYVLDTGIRFASMAETLKEFFIRERRSTVVAGTHGKTTSTAMLAWMLESAQRSPSFLVGGVARNFASSFQLGSGPDFIIEGDEYDTAFFDKGPKFLHYMPHIVLINNIEFDHADIYSDLEAIQLSFRRLMNIVPRSGLIVAGVDSPAVGELLPSAPAPVETFGLETGNWRADEICAGPDGTSFDVLEGDRLWHQFRTPLVGAFNVANALGAIVVAQRLGLSAEQIQDALMSFKNVRRRLEIRGEVQGITVYDDFAHHPTAVRETLKGVRSQFPDARIWAIFEPRSQTSRRRVFEAEFAASLSLANIAIVAPVYSPGHLEPSDVLSPERVTEEVLRRGREAHALNSTDEIVDFIAGGVLPGDRVVVMSNGSFDNIHQRLLGVLEAQNTRN